MPICTKELLFILLHHHIIHSEDDEAIKMFVEGKKNTIHKFIGRVLKKHKYSIHKNSISQSVPLDWWRKSEENTLRICTLFKAEGVKVVINADETFVLHMKDNCLIVPRGMKRVGTASQVHNDKMGATVFISVEFWTSMILPHMIIFTGVYGAKLMQQWEDFGDGEVLFVFAIAFYMVLFTSTLFCLQQRFFLMRVTGWPYRLSKKKNWPYLGKKSSHYSEEVVQFISDSNKDPNNLTISSALLMKA
jgi:hypothetical protein